MRMCPRRVATRVRTGGRAAGAVTSRAVLLGVVLIAVVLTVAYPLREYLSQRHQIAELEAEQAAREGRIAALGNQVRRWHDPAHIEARARARLHFVMPGETAYIVVGGGEPGDPEAAVPTTEPTGADSTHPWYAQLWSSVVGAGATGPRESG